MKKNLENIWFYYKVPILIIVIVLFIFIDYKISTRKVEKYDNSIAFISITYPSEEELNNIKNIFENKFESTFEIKVYNVELGADNQDQIILSKLDLDLVNSLSNYLLIEDINAFKKATNNLKLYNVALVKDLDWLKGHEIDNMTFATRK